MANDAKKAPTRKPGSDIEAAADAVETPGAFAEQAGQEFDRLQQDEHAEGVTGFVKKASDRIFSTWDKGGFWTKAAMIAGGVMAAYGAVKVVQKTFDAVFSTGDWIADKLDSNAGDTIISMLGLTGIAGVGGLLNAIRKGDISGAELMGAYGNGGLPAVGKLIVSKTASGTLNIPKDAWNGLAGTLGLPAFGSLSEVVNQGLEGLDEKIGFTRTKNAVREWFSAHGADQYIPDWLEHLDVGKALEGAGIDASDQDALKTYAVVGGGALLMMKCVGKFGVAMNAGLVMILMNQVEDGEAKKNFIKEAVGDKLDMVRGLEEKFPGVGSLLDESLPDMEEGGMFDQFSEWAGKNPALAFAAVNAPFIAFYHWRTVMGLLNRVKWAVMNPTKAGMVVLAAVTVLSAREGFIEEFIQLAYDDPQSDAARSTRELLRSITFSEEGEKLSLWDKQVPGYMKSLLEDPAKALRVKGDEYERLMKDGVLSFAWDESGRAWAIVQGMNVPYQLGKLSVEAFTSTLGHLFDENGEGTVFPMVYGGLSCLAFGAAAVGGLRAMASVVETADGFSGKWWRGAMSMVPGTPAWRFVLRSALQTPLIPFVKRHMAGGIAEVSDGLAEIREMMKRKPKPDMAAIAKKAHLLSENNRVFKHRFGDIKKHLVGTDFSYRFSLHMDEVGSALDDVRTYARNGDLTSISKQMDVAEGGISKYKTEVSSLIQRGELLLRGKFKEAFARRTPEIEGPKRPVFEHSPSLKKPKAELMKEYRALEKKTVGKAGLTALERTRMFELESFLNPKSALASLALQHRRLDGLTGPAKAKEMLRLAGDVRVMEKAMESKLASRVDAIIANATKKGLKLDSPQVTAQLTRLDKTITHPFAKQKASTLGKLFKEYEKLPASARSHELKGLMIQIQGGKLAKLSHAVKGKAKMMAPMAAFLFIEKVAHFHSDPDAEFLDLAGDLGMEGLQLALEIAVPFAGTASLFYSAFTGDEILTDHKVEGWWRVGSFAFGVASLAGDIVTVIGAPETGGLTLAASAGARGAIRGSKAARVMKKMPKIKKLIDKIGFSRFKELTTTFVKHGPDAVKKLRKVQRVSSGIGMAIMGGQIANMMYGFVADVDAPPAELMPAV